MAVKKYRLIDNAPIETYPEEVVDAKAYDLLREKLRVLVIWSQHKRSGALDNQSLSDQMKKQKGFDDALRAAQDALTQL